MTALVEYKQVVPARLFTASPAWAFLLSPHAFGNTERPKAGNFSPCAAALGVGTLSVGCGEKLKAPELRQKSLDSLLALAERLTA